MNTINWKEKLSSRKFWAMVAAFVASVLIAFNVGDNQIAQISAIITGFGAIAVYIFAEAAVDKARANQEVEEEDEEEI